MLGEIHVVLGGADVVGVTFDDGSGIRVLLHEIADLGHLVVVLRPDFGFIDIELYMERDAVFVAPGGRLGGRNRFERSFLLLNRGRLGRTKGICFCRCLFCQCGTFLSMARPVYIIGIVPGILGFFEFSRAGFVFSGLARCV